MGHTERVCYSKNGRPKAYNTSGPIGNITVPEGWKLVPINSQEVIGPQALQTGWSNKTMCLDSGSEVHYCPNESVILEYQAVSPQQIHFADGNSDCYIVGVGKMQVETRINGILKTMVLDNVCHVPKFKKTLISVGLLAKSGFTLDYSQDSKVQFIKKDEETVAVAAVSPTSNIYLFANNAWINPTAHNSTLETNSLELLHR